MEVAGPNALPFEAAGADSPRERSTPRQKCLNPRKTSIYGSGNEVQRSPVVDGEDFDLTEEQQMLADTARRVVGLRHREAQQGDRIRAGLEPGDLETAGRDRHPRPGTMRTRPIKASVVLTELGRRPAPDFDYAAALVPGAVIAAHGSVEQRALLDEVAAGEKLRRCTKPAVAVRRFSTPRHPGRLTLRTLTGREPGAGGDDSADVLAGRAALPDGGAGLFLVDAGATSRGYRTFDGQRGADITFDNSPARPLGAGGKASAVIAEAVIRFKVALYLRQAVGAMDESLH